jgi:hypothetical protein
MDDKEAAALLEAELAHLRTEPYSALVARMSAGSINCERVTECGVRYQVQIQIFWDGRPNKDIRVIGAIDDGGWRAFVPLSRDFIKAPDDSFVGE